jgi:hypothetical protein
MFTEIHNKNEKSIKDIYELFIIFSIDFNI